VLSEVAAACLLDFPSAPENSAVAAMGIRFAARPVALGESKMAPIISIAGCVLLFVGLCAAVVNLSQDDNTSVRR
jgi:hypothetical protein